MKILDTNILMSGKATKGIILYPVLQELDRLKTAEGLKGKQARDAISDIHKNPQNYELKYEETKPNQSVDDFLVEYAWGNSLTLCTMDISLNLKAKARGCTVDYMYNGEDHYSGVTYLNEEQVSDLIAGKYTTPHPLNHFLIYGKQAFINTPTGFEEISYHSFKNEQVGEIQPRNIEQYCLAEILKRNIPIVNVNGGWGVGKSWLLLNHAIKQLEKGNLQKLVIIPNNAAVADTMEVGTLPGDVFSKLGAYSNVLLDIYSIDQINMLLFEGRLEIIPLAMLRGRNLSNSIIWVSEAANISSAHMKLILGRAAENTRIFIDGDLRQCDKKIFETKSGIRLLKQLAFTESADLFATIELQKVERSRVSQTAAILDELY